MLDIKKENPVYKLEKKFRENGFIVGQLDKEGCLDSNEKMMYDFMNVVYEQGQKSKKPSKILMTILFFVGLIVGGLIGVFGVLQLIKK